MKVRAREYVICAGALESARCVLELSEACGGLSHGVQSLAGRFLHDHLSVRLARVRVDDHAEFQRLFAPIFDGPTMRSLRMELSEDFLLREGLPALYAHFLFEAAPDSGFALLRDTLRELQRGRIDKVLAGLPRILPALPGIVEIAVDRYARRRLSFPRNCATYLQLDFEQSPLRENRVYLGHATANGRRALHVDWDARGDAAAVARRAQAAFARLWSRNGLERVAHLEYVDYQDGQDIQPTHVHDLYHPAGTTRMSSDPNEGVVSPDMRVYGTGNAYVAGSAVFPSMGAANPTFTAMALGVRLAEVIDRGLPAG